MPRKSTPEPTPGIGHNNPPVEPVLTADQLVAAHLAIKDWIAAETKRFDEYLAPQKARQQAIDQKLHEMLVGLGSGDKAMLSGDSGTAYLSTIMNASVSPEGAPYTRVSDGLQQSVGRDALLDFALDHWDEIGNELLLVSAQKDAIRRWMDEHEGVPPPGIKVSYFTRVNVRRS